MENNILLIGENQEVLTARIQRLCIRHVNVGRRSLAHVVGTEIHTQIKGEQ